MRARIRSIESRLDKVRQQRKQGRRSRQRASVPTISLVGYTNAGKSTLFNRLTGAGVYAEDQLFATLDPTMRRIHLDAVGTAILADTVGFISHLPHRLVAAFQATLEEAAQSTCLLHIIDAAAEERARDIAAVEWVLGEIGALELPRLQVYNKLDLLPDRQPRIERDDQGIATGVWLSAESGEGVDLLFKALTEHLGKQLLSGRLHLNHQNNQLARLRSRLYAMSVVAEEVYRDDGSSEIAITIPTVDWRRLLSAEAIDHRHLPWLGTVPMIVEE